MHKVHTARVTSTIISPVTFNQRYTNLAAHLGHNVSEMHNTSPVTIEKVGSWFLPDDFLPISQIFASFTRDRVCTKKG
jgi:hypothetical protein